MLLAAACAATGTGTEGGGLAGPPDELVSPDRPAELDVGTVIWVADGDSIDVETDQGEQEIRLLGVNAAESGECFSEESRDYLIASVKDRSVGLEISDTDQFDRNLASVWNREELVNLALVERGLALALTPGEGDPLGRLLIAAENDAYEAGIGLWSLDACGAKGPLPGLSIDLGESQIDPPGPDEDDLEEEYVVIVNDDDISHDLSGWTLRDESSRNRLEFGEGTTIDAAESLVVSSGCETKLSWCSGSPIWNNSGDMVLLLDETGRVVARARY